MLTLLPRSGAMRPAGLLVSVVWTLNTVRAIEISMVEYPSAVEGGCARGERTPGRDLISLTYIIA